MLIWRCRRCWKSLWRHTSHSRGFFQDWPSSLLNSTADIPIISLKHLPEETLQWWPISPNEKLPFENAANDSFKINCHTAPSYCALYCIVQPSCVPNLCTQPNFSADDFETWLLCSNALLCLVSLRRGLETKKQTGGLENGLFECTARLDRLFCTSCSSALIQCCPVICIL